MSLAPFSMFQELACLQGVSSFEWHKYNMSEVPDTLMRGFIGNASLVLFSKMLIWDIRLAEKQVCLTLPPEPKHLSASKSIDVWGYMKRTWHLLLGSMSHRWGSAKWSKTIFEVLCAGSPSSFDHCACELEAPMPTCVLKCGKTSRAAAWPAAMCKFESSRSLHFIPFWNLMGEKKTPACKVKASGF